MQKCPFVQTSVCTSKHDLRVLQQWGTKTHGSPSCLLQSRSLTATNHALLCSKPHPNRHTQAACHCRVAVHVSFYPMSSLVSMCPPNQPLPRAQGNHRPARQAQLWLYDLFFTSNLAEPFPECFLLLTRREQDFLSPASSPSLFNQ